MKTSKTSTEKRRAAPLISLCVFIGVHIVMCIMNSCFLPAGKPWNIIFLGGEFALAGAAAVCCVIALVSSRRDAGGPAELRQLGERFRRPEFFLVLAWFVCSVAACFLAIGQGLGGLYHNGRYLFDLGASLVIAFPLGFYLGSENRRGLLHLVYDLLLLAFCLFIMYGFYRFFRGDFSFTALFDRVYHMKRLRVRMGQNTNTTGCYSVFFLVMGIYRFASLKKGWKKALLILALIPIGAAYAMTESRSAVVSGAVACGVLAGAAVYRRREKKDAATILLSLAVFALTAGAFIGVFYGVRRLLNLMQQRVIKHYAAKVPKKTANPSGIIKEDVAELGGRKDVWRSVILHVFHNPGLLLHGCTQSSTVMTVKALIGKNFNTHNQFLEVLLAYGLPSMLLFLAWLIPVARNSIALGLDVEAPDSRWMLPAVLLLLIVNNMAETMLVGRGHFAGGMFFLIAGYVCAMAPRKKKKSDPAGQ